MYNHKHVLEQVVDDLNAQNALQWEAINELREELTALKEANSGTTRKTRSRTTANSDDNS